MLFRSAFVSNPDQFGDTEKLRAAGKLDAKLAQRQKLMSINYAQLPDEEQEKDRVVARALLQALTGGQGVTEVVDWPTLGAAATLGAGAGYAFTKAKDWLADRQWKKDRAEYQQKRAELLKKEKDEQQGVAEGAKVDRMVKHIAKSERKLGKSKKEDRKSTRLNSSH